MPVTVPTPSVNIIQARATQSSLASSPFGPGSFSANSALRRPSIALSVGSFHSAQLRRPSFFAPFPYHQSPQQSDLSNNALQDYSSSPGRGGNVYERDLEANYCKNFSCCGLTLGDLHALLQHYEESHVHFEEDEDLLQGGSGGFTDDDGWSTHSDSAPNSPQMGASCYPSSSSSAAHAAAAATVAALTAATGENKHTPLSFLNAKKKSNGVSLSDIYSEDIFASDEAISAFPNSILRTTIQAKDSGLACKKRDLATYSSSFDTQSPLSKKASTLQNKALSNQTSQSSINDLKSGSQVGTTTVAQDDLLATVTGYLEHAIQQGMLPNCGEVGSPAYLSAAEDLIRKRDEIVSMMESIGKSGSPGTDKPYRCSVNGCDKAYKNPNGLKYHNQHGHCSVPGSSEDDKLNAKPYRCTFLECGKCYKNLNGLKYHIEHSHPNLAAALHAHIPGFATLDGTNVSQAAIAAAAAIAAVQANPMMMAAANAIMASAAAAGQANRMSSSSAYENTPESSPNSSPILGPIATQTANRGANVMASTPLSIQTSLGQGSGMLTPSSLSPSSSTSSAAPRSPTGSQVSTLTAALAAVSVEQQRQEKAAADLLPTNASTL